MSTATETQKYTDVWQALPQYAEYSPGASLCPVFLQMVGDERGTVLDAGTGSGKGALALAAAGFHVTCCDVTNAGLIAEAHAFPFYPACLWKDLWSLARATHPSRTRFDFVYCTDVLEHIPQQFTMLAVDQMLRVSRRGLFLGVSLRVDEFGMWVGSQLHQTVQPFVWWRDNLRELGDVVEARDLLTSAVFLVRR